MSPVKPRRSLRWSESKEKDGTSGEVAAAQTPSGVSKNTRSKARNGVQKLKWGKSAGRTSSAWNDEFVDIEDGPQHTDGGYNTRGKQPPPSKDKPEPVDGGDKTGPTQQRGEGPPPSEDDSNNQANPDDQNSENPFTPAPTRRSNNSQNRIYMRPRYTRAEISKGDILNIPHHMTNLDPGKTTEGQGVRSTDAGGVYSKNRNCVVLYKFQTKMLVVPFYSFAGIGITAKSGTAQREMIEVIEDGHTWTGNGPNGYLRARMNATPGFRVPTCANLTSLFPVDYKVNMRKVGNLVSTSRDRLERVMDGLIVAAKAEIR